MYEEDREYQLALEAFEGEGGMILDVEAQRRADMEREYRHGRRDGEDEDGGLAPLVA